MKEVATTAVAAVALLGYLGIALATPPLFPPVQYEQFCDGSKISGSGVIDTSTTVIDKQIALEYYDVKNGDGDFEMDQEHVYSQNSDKLSRSVAAINANNSTNLNLYGNTKITYSGAAPLIGGKYLNSKSFYGGIGADVQEMYAVNEMESDEQTFFSSTVPYNASPNILNDLKAAGRDTGAVARIMGPNNPAHLMGISTKNSFNGTWGTDAKWHKIFYKDIKAHESFTGKFEAEKTLKFHENPVPEAVSGTAACLGVDC